MATCIIIFGDVRHSLNDEKTSEFICQYGDCPPIEYLLLNVQNGYLVTIEERSEELFFLGVGASGPELFQCHLSPHFLFVFLLQMGKFLSKIL